MHTHTHTQNYAQTEIRTHRHTHRCPPMRTHAHTYTHTHIHTQPIVMSYSHKFLPPIPHSLSILLLLLLSYINILIPPLLLPALCTPASLPTRASALPSTVWDMPTSSSCSPLLSAFTNSDCSAPNLAHIASLLSPGGGGDGGGVSSLLIYGGVVVNEDGWCGGDVLVVGGVIKLVCEAGVMQGGGVAGGKGGGGIVELVGRVVDARGKMVMPGGIDPHTHLDMPFMGTVSCDDFDSGHRAGLAGGTTMHIDFVLPHEGSMIKGYDMWKKKAETKSHMDYAFHSAVTGWNKQIEQEMSVLVQQYGINSFKFFMAYKGALMVTDEQLLQGMRAAKQLGALVQVHAENGDAVKQWQDHIADDLRIMGPEGHALSRPSILEGEATERAITLARLVNVPLYVVHVMSADALAAVRRAKERGDRVIGEATLSGIALDEGAMWSNDFDWAAAHVMSPPIRKYCVDGLSLQQAIKEGVIEALGSDHATFNTSQKRLGRHDFRLIPNGVNGMEERIPLSWHILVSGKQTKSNCSRGEQGGLSEGSGKEEGGGGKVQTWLNPSEFVKVTSTNIAKVFSLYPRKGIITAGSDADMYVFDPHGSAVIAASSHQSNVDINVFEGLSISGKVEITVRRGEVVYEHGKILSSPGSGRLIPTPPYSPFLYTGLSAEDKRRAAQLAK
eukprot:GHVQ01030251.1.p1 GENE.GHVQ01030251.1~~GHVQ01030251.1.p1  ORF type:complete len:671 (-),score=134.14 GHVQ01030251.1:85-2097(-)